MFRITEEDARVLAQARFVLERLQRGAQAEINTMIWDNHVAANLGKLSEASDLAGHLVFNVLSTASSYLHDPIAKAFVHKKLPPTPFEAATDWTAEEVMAREG